MKSLYPSALLTNKLEYYFKIGLEVIKKMTTATALIRDSFDGKEMGQVLSITKALGLLAPMLAPQIGAFILIYLHLLF